MARSYFSNLFTSDPRGDREFSLHGRFPEVDLVALQRLADPVTDEEVKRAIFDMGPLKAPGQFSVKSAYRIQNGIVEGPNEDIWKVIARFKGTQRMRIFLWLACRDKIMTNYERMKRHFVSDARCGLCGADVEDVDHILTRCPNSFLVWKLVRADKMQDFMSCDIKSWIKINLTQPHRFAIDIAAWGLMFGGVCWFIWLRRNDLVFNVGREEVRRPVLDRARHWLASAVAATGAAALSRHLPTQVDRSWLWKYAEITLLLNSLVSYVDWKSERFAEFPLQIMLTLTKDLDHVATEKIAGIMEEDDSFQSVHFGKAPDTRYQAEIPKKRLQLTSMKPESQVIVGQPYGGEFVSGPRP
ncbi:hypothetical protein V6N12_053980 [Hibiscus sabdariffa]|uniref:Reverse transcriptase zinc-binding domain-containing protein n=1 Tax=Hibiscus sabdariffa TaxID=183260 RepID=A0ABR2D976_9ROSI